MIKRVQLILAKINVGILLKVDEPENFKFIYQKILSEEMTQEKAFELQEKLIEAGIKLDLITIISKMDMLISCKLK